MCDRLVSIAFAGVSGLALVCGYCQVPYTPLHGVLPFLLLGLGKRARLLLVLSVYVTGVDDMFVITDAFDLTDPLDPIPKRIKDSLTHSASAVLVRQSHYTVLS